MLGRMFRNHYWTVNDIRKLLKERWKLEPQNNSLATSNTTLIIQEVFIKIIKLDAISQLKKISFFKNLMK
jgi:hypothetical protein